SSLLALSPDMFLLNINQTDIIDVIVRGGFERFDTSAVFKDKNPWWNGLYGSSYTFRLFVHRVLKKNRLFLNERDMATETEKAISIIVDAVSRFKTFCKQNNIE